MSKGIVYILTNPCLEGWVKIGMTEKDVEERVKSSSNSTAIPLSFRCYATYEVDNAFEVEQRIHKLIDIINGSLHAKEQLNSGKTKTKEFFRMSPEAAYELFRNVAILRGDINKLNLYEPTQEQLLEEEIGETTSKRASNNSFLALNIPVGEEIVFLPDDSIKATVADNKNLVEYNNEKMAISSLAHNLLVTHCGWSETSKVNGWRYFLKNGVPLSDLRNLSDGTDELSKLI